MAPSPSTIAHGGAGAGARAKGTPFRSSSPSSDHTKARSTGALSRGHCARGVVRVDHVVKVRQTFTRPTVDAFTSLNWPGLRVRRFSRIPDRRAGLLLPSLRRRPVRASSQAHSRTGRSIHAVRLHSGRMQSLAGQLRSQLVADLVIHANRLSFLVLVGIDPNEIGLTDEAKPLSPDDKIYD